jgi:predicted site-specific integrase-resolvase
MRTLADERLLDLHDAAMRMNISIAQLRRYIATGQISVIQFGGRPGGHIRIRESELSGVMDRWQMR